MSRPEVEDTTTTIRTVTQHHARLFRRRSEALEHLAAILERGGTLRAFRVHRGAELYGSTDPDVTRAPKRKPGRRRARRKPGETREEQIRRLARERQRRARARKKEEERKK